MGRKKDPEKARLIEKLGASPNKNWTKEELLAMEKRQAEKEAKDAEKAALTHIVAGDVPAVAPAELEIPFDLRGQEDPFSGLTERQKRIARLRMRGLSQQAIANLEGVSQPIISQELKKIKDWQAERGANVDQHVIVGGTGTLYEEVEQMAWQMYYTPEISVGEKAKCLAVVMAAREKHTKLLMDLGLIKKASSEVKVTHEISPFLATWKEQQKKELADSIVAGQLKALPEPEPEREDVVDAEFAEVMEDVEIVVPKSDLAEPTPDDEVEIDE
jgi:hypothetical protein